MELKVGISQFLGKYFEFILQKKYIPGSSGAIIFFYK
jgi:hypothetical protein